MLCLFLHFKPTDLGMSLTEDHNLDVKFRRALGLRLEIECLLSLRQVCIYRAESEAPQGSLILVW